MKRIFLTGATGVMGLKGMKEILALRDRRRESALAMKQSGHEDGLGEEIELTVLARPGKRNEKKLKPFIERGVRVIRGDLLDPEKIKEGVEGADVVLHVGGMVSPAADYEPEKTYKVNTESMKLIVDAALERERHGHTVTVVYIGSVAQYGDRSYPHQWGRAGDPIASASFDKYALSKSVAELILSESGLKRWVSIRQTSILHPGLLGKAVNPVAFHVPMAGALEWVTDDDSGRLLAALCKDDIPEEFWKNYYNVGGGDSFRMSNYEFMKATLDAVGCPPPEKVFDLQWFATRNFHGMFYQDSDLLDSFLHYRNGETCGHYLERLKKGLPFYYRLAPLAPSFVIKKMMGMVADKEKLGTRRWIKENNGQRIEAAFGGREEYEKIPDWNDFEIPPLLERGVRLDHGYDEQVPLECVNIGQLQKSAAFRGGSLIGTEEDLQPAMPEKSCDGENGGTDPDKKMTWECSEGHRFRLTPRTVLKGGHWCPECLAAMERDPKELRRLAEKNRFLRQIAH